VQTNQVAAYPFFRETSRVLDFGEEAVGERILHKVDGKDLPLEIRWSTDDDLGKILQWLKEEDRFEIHGNFLCNWELTRECHNEGKLLVLIDKLQELPIGYQWGQLLRPGIMQIRNEWRRKGLGRLLVEHCIGLANQQDEAVLRIECKPSSSVSFWESMGFEIVRGTYDQNAKAYQILTKKLELPGQGESVKVRVSSYPEEKKWHSDIHPLSIFSPIAVRGSEGIIYFEERVAFYSADPNRDLVIEIILDNTIVYCDKAKYEPAKHHGVKWCRNGFFMDFVEP
jgi:GNAT superfamily N-acetyltransferase